MKYKRSKQKEAIIKALEESASHPDAEWIFQRVRETIPGISLATVYRNLRLLSEAGIVREVVTGGGSTRYDMVTRPHYHFRCDVCGRVYDLEERVNRTIERRVAAKTGFKVTRHTLELAGICSLCLQSENKTEK